MGLHPADGGDAALDQGRPGALWKDTGEVRSCRRRWSPRHVHLVDTRFITSMGHGLPAMMPVRRQGEVVSLKSGGRDGDEHGRHAVKGGAFFGGDRFAR